MGTSYHYQLILGVCWDAAGLDALRQRCAQDLPAQAGDREWDAARRFTDWLVLASNGRLGVFEVSASAEPYQRTQVVGTCIGDYSQKSAPEYVLGPWGPDAFRRAIEGCKRALDELGVEADVRVFLLANVG